MSDKLNDKSNLGDMKSLKLKNIPKDPKKISKQISDLEKQVKLLKSVKVESQEDYEKLEALITAFNTNSEIIIKEIEKDSSPNTLWQKIKNNLEKNKIYYGGAFFLSFIFIVWQIIELYFTGKLGYVTVAHFAEIVAYSGLNIYQNSIIPFAKMLYQFCQTLLSKLPKIN